MDISALASALTSLLGSNNFFYAREEGLASLRSPFSCRSFLNPPFAVARPVYPAQVSRILALCNDFQMPVRFRGNQHSLFPNPFPEENPWLLIESAGLCRILEFSPENLLVRVMAGIDNEKLQSELARQNFHIPALDQRSGRTIGGILAENMAQAQYPKYGSPASCVLSMRVALANGTELELNGAAGSPCRQLPESPLAQLFCGSRGQLGFITEATLRVMPLPKREMAFAAQGQLENLLAYNLSLSRCLPAAAFLMDASLAAISGLPERPALLVCFDNPPEELARIKENIYEKAGEYQLSIGEASIGKPDFYRFFTSILAGTANWDLQAFACQPEQLGRFLTAIHGIAKTWKIRPFFMAYPWVASIYCLFLHDGGKNWASARKELRELKLIMADMPLTEEDLTTPAIGNSLNLRGFLDPAGILSRQGENA